MDSSERFFEEKYQEQYYLYAANEERTAAEVAFLIEQLQIDRTSCVLDLACGNGRHSLGIAVHAGQVVGRDVTPHFISSARQAGEQAGLSNLYFEVADMRELSDCEVFDSAFNYFTAWGYFDHDKNIGVLARVLKSLKPGGRFLLEIMFRDRLMTVFKQRDFSVDTHGQVTLDERRFDFSTGRLHNTRTYIEPDGSRSVIDFDHYVPSSDALVRHFEGVGFTDVRAMEAPTGAELSLQSTRLAVIGVKPS